MYTLIKAYRIQISLGLQDRRSANNKFLDLENGYSKDSREEEGGGTMSSVVGGAGDNKGRESDKMGRTPGQDEWWKTALVKENMTRGMVATQYKNKFKQLLR